MTAFTFPAPSPLVPEQPFSPPPKPGPEQLDLFAKLAQSPAAIRVAERLRTAHEALTELERKTAARGQTVETEAGAMTRGRLVRQCADVAPLLQWAQLQQGILASKTWRRARTSSPRKPKRRA